GGHRRRHGGAVRHALPQRAALEHEPGLQPDHGQRLVHAVHLDDHELGGVGLHPDRARLPGVDVLGVPAPHQPVGHPGADRAGLRRHDTGGGPDRRHGSARTMKPLDPRLLRHASAARRFVILAAATAVLTAGLVLVQAQLLAGGVTRAFLGGDTLVALAPVLVALLVVVACRAALAWLAEVAAHRASTDVIRQLRSKLVTHALRLGPRHGGLPPTGELATLATRGLDGL